MLTAAKRGKVETSIAIVASFDGYSLNGYKIAIQRFDGLRDTTMKEVGGSRAGTNCIPTQLLKEMFETSGQKVIEAHTEIGDKHER